MFLQAYVFNQDIGAWNVSSGAIFVSLERSFGISIQYALYTCDLIESSNEWHLLVSLFFVSCKCLHMPMSSTKT
jgi:hypothetical protein